eukprot:1159613-Pelagomonas_calceolata.AAC.3
MTSLKQGNTTEGSQAGHTIGMGEPKPRIPVEANSVVPQELTARHSRTWEEPGFETNGERTKQASRRGWRQRLPDVQKGP